MPTKPAPARDRLIRAAARLFMARSYEAVGVAEICAAAKVQKGGFYHSFASKSDLVIAVIDHHAAALWDLLDRFEGRKRSPVNKIRATADAVGDIQGRLYAFFGRIVGCPLGNLAVELATIDAAAGQHVASVFEQWERRVARHCQDAADAGQLDLDVDPARLAHQIIATMQGMIVLAKASGTGPAEIPRAMHKVIDSGLRQHAA
jgi:TetR/AcrR family transcriptional regulator, transcriptional repressor for nem operon